jgi:hypothetical protein
VLQGYETPPSTVHLHIGVCTCNSVRHCLHTVCFEFQITVSLMQFVFYVNICILSYKARKHVYEKFNCSHMTLVKTSGTEIQQGQNTTTL